MDYSDFHEVGPTGDSNPSRTEYVSKLSFTLTKEADHRQLSVDNMEWSHCSLQPRSAKLKSSACRQDLEDVFDCGC